MLIVTHTAPDLDAALGTWLIARYMQTSEHDVIMYGFVPAGQTREEADFVVDTGREYIASEGRYDHHMPELANDTSISAASLVYQACMAVHQPAEVMRELIAIKPLVELVVAGDHGRAPAWSYEVGPHAQASSIRNRLRGDDHATLAALHQLIDDIAGALIVRAQVAAEFGERAYPVGERIVLIRDGSALLTRYALDTNGMGYELALFVSDHRDQSPPTIAVGMQRATESALHCGALVDAMQARAAQAGDGEVVAELQRWYRHPSGFFAGRGTAKAPDVTPVSERVIQTIAALLAQCLREAEREAE